MSNNFPIIEAQQSVFRANSESVVARSENGDARVIVSPVTNTARIAELVGDLSDRIYLTAVNNPEHPAYNADAANEFEREGSVTLTPRSSDAQKQVSLASVADVELAPGERTLVIAWGFADSTSSEVIRVTQLELDDSLQALADAGAGEVFEARFQVRDGGVWKSVGVMDLPLGAHLAGTSEGTGVLELSDFDGLCEEFPVFGLVAYVPVAACGE